MLKNIVFFFKFASFYLQGKNPFFEVYIKGKKTLDLGSGEGDLIKYDPKNIIGIDNNKGAIERCLAKGYQVKEGIVTKIPFSDYEFEVVNCRMVIEHLFPNEARQMIVEMKRVLKDDGIIILTSPMPNKVWNSFGHIKPYPPASIEKLFREVTLESFDSVRGLETQRVIYYSRWSGWKLFSPLLNLLAQLSPVCSGAYVMIIKKKNNIN